jgi:hypothetical protein
MSTANAMSISRAAVAQSAVASTRHVTRIYAVALGLLLYGLVMSYLLVVSAGIWANSRPADAPFSIPAPPIALQVPVAEQSPNNVPARPQAGFAPR